MFILSWIPKGGATASAMDFSWSLAELVHVPAESLSVIISAQQYSLQLGGLVLIT
jgi:hypothetical protein